MCERPVTTHRGHRRFAIPFRHSFGTLSRPQIAALNIQQREFQPFPHAPSSSSLSSLSSSCRSRRPFPRGLLPRCAILPLLPPQRIKTRYLLLLLLLFSRPWRETSRERTPPSLSLASLSIDDAFGNSRGRKGKGTELERETLWNYGRWKTADLPGRRGSSSPIYQQIYGVALHAWLTLSTEGGRGEGEEPRVYSRRNRPRVPSVHPSFPYRIAALFRGKETERKGKRSFSNEAIGHVIPNAGPKHRSERFEPDMTRIRAIMR